MEKLKEPTTEQSKIEKDFRKSMDKINDVYFKALEKWYDERAKATMLLYKNMREHETKTKKTTISKKTVNRSTK